jgi:hypothetical protein
MLAFSVTQKVIRYRHIFALVRPGRAEHDKGCGMMMTSTGYPETPDATYPTDAEDEHA